jgi:hypothetical protein
LSESIPNQLEVAGVLGVSDSLVSNAPERAVNKPPSGQTREAAQMTGRADAGFCDRRQDLVV